MTKSNKVKNRSRLPTKLTLNSNLIGILALNTILVTSRTNLNFQRLFVFSAPNSKLLIFLPRKTEIVQRITETTNDKYLCCFEIRGYCLVYICTPSLSLLSVLKFVSHRVIYMHGCLDSKEQIARLKSQLRVATHTTAA